MVDQLRIRSLITGKRFYTVNIEDNSKMKGMLEACELNALNKDKAF